MSTVAVPVKRHIYYTDAHQLPKEHRVGSLIIQCGGNTLNFSCPCGLKWTWGKVPYKGIDPVLPEKEYIRDARLWRGVCSCGNIVWKRGR
jgi:hypothetical protein